MNWLQRSGKGADRAIGRRERRDYCRTDAGANGRTACGPLTADLEIAAGSGTRELPVRGKQTRAFGLISGQSVLDKTETAQCQARPHRRTEIKRHPGDLVLPVREVMGD